MQEGFVNTICKYEYYDEYLFYNYLDQKPISASVHHLYFSFAVYSK